MCGITGYVQTISYPEVLDRMLHRLSHRGPDGKGKWISRHSQWEIALGHNRLSIIDVNGGQQPIGNEDNSIFITFNGEIYNFQELRKYLISNGHQFKTHTDTEVIIHYFEQVGLDCLPDLNGMFSFALWNHNTGELLLARDKVGIKPLYYTQTPDGGLVFASELNVLFEFPKVSKILNKSALASYFFSDYIQAPDSIIEDIKKLPPAHYVIWKNGTLSSPKSYWNLHHLKIKSQFIHGKHPSDKAQAVHLWDTMKHAVNRQLIADVPVGVFLSGGLDSSTIAALAQMQTSHPLKTFSLAFDDPAFDESTYSRQVAKFLGTEHFEETLTEQTVLNTLEAALDCLDEPLADPSLLPTFLLSKLASQHVKVVLGGDGGDELFAGYPTYLAHQYAQAYRQIPEWLRSRIISNFVRKLPTKNTYQSLEWKIKRFIFRWDNNPVVRHFRWMSNTDLQDLSEIITASPSIINNIDDFTSLQLQEPSNHMLALDFLTYLPGSVLTKVDRASMAHGLEVRPPFLDSEVVELAFLTPLQIKLRKGKEKYLLKMAAQNYLPKEIILRKKKGFAIPLARWLKGPLRQKIEETLIYSPLWKSQTLNQHTFIKWNKEHQIGAIDRSRSLWALLVLDHWIRKNNILERS